MDEQILPDLLRLRGSVMAASDEFFAAKENLFKPNAPVFVPETYDAKGQVYDGWETRRRRGPGGTVPDRGAASLQAMDAADPAAGLLADERARRDLLPRVRLLPDTPHRFRVQGPPATHVRLNIFPDGGIARLRLYRSLTDDGLSALRRRRDETG
jgi:allantoicase